MTREVSDNDLRHTLEAVTCREVDRTWVLEDAKGGTTFRGNREAGLSGSAFGAGYFLLVKEGANVTAVPVEEWYNFRTVAR